ncbi:hypothetical protein GCM10017687_37780 [Streptomyces echinatus]
MPAQKSEEPQRTEASLAEAGTGTGTETTAGLAPEVTTGAGVTGATGAAGVTGTTGAAEVTGPAGVTGTTGGRADIKMLPEPPGLPAPLPEPAVSELRLETVLGALSDPLRLGIVRKLLLEAEAFDHTCGWFGLDRPKSSLTHHFKALREAGITRQRQYGLERRSHVRVADLNARFPGLLDLVAAWTPPTTD